MRILIYGAGVIGSLYAVLLKEAGYDTTIYARGHRLDILQNQGLLYKKNNHIKKIDVKVLDQLQDDDRYDCPLDGLPQQYFCRGRDTCAHCLLP